MCEWSMRMIEKYADFTATHMVIERMPKLEKDWQKFARFLKAFGGKYVYGQLVFEFPEGTKALYSKACAKRLKPMYESIAVVREKNKKDRLNKKPKNQNKEKVMLKIEKVTLVNGARAEDLLVNDYLKLIQQEIVDRDSVSILSKDCKTAVKVKSRCNKNIKALEKLLDEVNK